MYLQRVVDAEVKNEAAPKVFKKSPKILKDEIRAAKSAFDWAVQQPEYKRIKTEKIKQSKNKKKNWRSIYLSQIVGSNVSGGPVPNISKNAPDTLRKEIEDFQSALQWAEAQPEYHTLREEKLAKSKMKTAERRASLRRELRRQKKIISLAQQRLDDIEAILTELDARE